MPIPRATWTREHSHALLPSHPSTIVCDHRHRPRTIELISRLSFPLSIHGAHPRARPVSLSHSYCSYAAQNVTPRGKFWVRKSNLRRTGGSTLYPSPPVRGKGGGVLGRPLSQLDVEKSIVSRGAAALPPPRPARPLPCRAARRSLRAEWRSAANSRSQLYSTHRSAGSL